MLGAASLGKDLTQTVPCIEKTNNLECPVVTKYNIQLLLDFVLRFRIYNRPLSTREWIAAAKMAYFDSKSARFGRERARA